MGGLQRALAFFTIAPLASCLAGCITVSLHSRTPMEVLVLDAETEAPLSGVPVSIGYGKPEVFIVLNMPKNETFETDADGYVTISVANNKWGWGCTASATGYIPISWWGLFRQDPIPVSIRDVYNDQQEQREITVRLYRQPKPSISLIVPNDYRGPLKIDLRPSPDFVQGEIGQREFVFNVSDTGYVGIEASPLLLQWPRVLVSYADGTKIHDRSYYYEPDADSNITLHYVVNTETRWLYMIGTKAEADALHEQVFQHVTDPYPARLLKQEAFEAIFSE